MVINNTKCGMLTFKGTDLAARLEDQTGERPTTPARFHTFTDLDDNVRQRLDQVRAHPWLPDRVSVRGIVYDVDTSRLHEVKT